MSLDSNLLGAGGGGGGSQRSQDHQFSAHIITNCTTATNKVQSPVQSTEGGSTSGD